MKKQLDLKVLINYIYFFMVIGMIIWIFLIPTENLARKFFVMGVLILLGIWYNTLNLLDWKLIKHGKKRN